MKKKTINTYEDYLNLSPEEEKNLDIDSYSIAELEKIIHFGIKFSQELIACKNKSSKNIPSKFSSLKEQLAYFQSLK